MEKKRWQEDRNRIQRDKDMAENGDWEKKEDEFLLKQAKLRAEIRLKEGRGKPIDYLYKNLSGDFSFDVEFNSPDEILHGLSSDEVIELKKDIQMYASIDPKHLDFWQIHT